MLGNTDMLELRDYVRVQRGLPLLQVLNEALYERLMSRTSALRSILPCTEGRIGDIDSHSIPSMRMGVHMSDLHRHLLCALGNNLAGLGNISGQQLYHLLRMVSDEHVIVKLLCEGGHLRLPIAQQLLRACIEVGNASMVDTILSMRMLQVHINELTCEVGGEPYTALERASTLRNKALVDVMLRHGADVHKTCDRYTSLEIGSGGALECALLGSTEDGRLDPQIFNTIFGRMDRVNLRTLEILMNGNEHGFLIDVLKKLAHANHDDWRIANWPECIWHKFLRGLKQEGMAMEILAIMEKLGVAETTRTLNIAASNGHQTVVLRLLHRNISLDEESLCSAIRGKNEELVRLFLKKGATVDIHREKPGQGDGEDPYSEAIQTKDERIIRILVEHHALKRLDQWDFWRRAWKAAVRVCNKEVLAMLLSKQQHIPAHHLGRALSSISKLGDYEMAIELLNGGAELDALSDELGYPARRGYVSQSPLVAALEAEQYLIADLILKSGANPNSNIRHHEKSPIELAVRNGNHTMLEKLLVAGALGNPAAGSSAFLEAVKRKDFKMMDKLWDAGAFSDAALEVAAEYDSVDVCDWLLSRGANPRNSRALYNAYRSKSPSFGALLSALRVRYPLGVGGCFAPGVLCEALKSYDRSAVELLLQHGADPNGFFQDYRQQVTPLFIAVTLDAGNDTSWVELFLDWGHKSKASRCTPQTVVARLKDFDRGPPGPMITALLAAVGTKNIPMVRLLSRREDADIDFPASGRIKRTPLQRAAEIGSLDLVEFFYGSGADVNAPPAREGGATALQLAAQGGFTAIVVYLLSKGANADAPGALIHGMTALECAAAHGRVDVLYCLLRANAGQGGRDHKQFQRASTHAEKAAHLSIVDMLRDHLQSVGQYSLSMENEDQSAATEEIVT